MHQDTVKINRFMLLTKATREEAILYLEASSYRLRLAILAYRCKNK